jgi:hypothetical protein
MYARSSGSLLLPRRSLRSPRPIPPGVSGLHLPVLPERSRLFARSPAPVDLFPNRRAPVPPSSASSLPIPKFRSPSGGISVWPGISRVCRAEVCPVNRSAGQNPEAPCFSFGGTAHDMVRGYPNCRQRPSGQQPDGYRIGPPRSWYLGSAADIHALLGARGTHQYA